MTRIFLSRGGSGADFLLTAVERRRRQGNRRRDRHRKLISGEKSPVSDVRPNPALGEPQSSVMQMSAGTVSVI